MVGIKSFGPLLRIEYARFVRSVDRLDDSLSPNFRN